MLAIEIAAAVDADDGATVIQDFLLKQSGELVVPNKRFRDRGWCLRGGGIIIIIDISIASVGSEITAATIVIFILISESSILNIAIFFQNDIEEVNEAIRSFGSRFFALLGCDGTRSDCVKKLLANVDCESRIEQQGSGGECACRGVA